MTHGSSRLPALDGLRGIAVLLVLCSHLFQVIGLHHLLGTYGVTIFFFISGFIITRLLLRENLETGTIKLIPFYVRRWFRLTPALVVYVAISVLLLALAGHRIPTSDLQAVLLYYANYHDIYSPFATSSAPWASEILSPFIITWSLAVEEHFYLLFPPLLLVLRQSTAKLLGVLIGFIVLTLVWRAYLSYGHHATGLLRIYKGTDTRLDSIAYGCLLSVIFFRASLGGKREKGFLHALRGYRGACAGGVIFAVSLVSRNAEFKDTFLYSIQGLALMGLFCSVFWKEPAKRLRDALSRPELVYIGTISYSLYLYHYLGLVVAQLLTQSQIGELVIAWTLTIAGSLFSYYSIEGPSRQVGYRVAKWASRMVGYRLAEAR